VRTYDGGWCYDWGLADSLLVRPGANRWTEAAFLERTNIGWEAPCDICGSQPFGADQWRAILEHGERFLEVYPNSVIAPAVTLSLAQAHETAWSLSKTRKGDDYVDPDLYRVEAPQHRAQAIALYTQLLATRPGDPAYAPIRARLARLQIDVDTSYHRYWCVWD
jgi:hypothetical protein